MIHNTTTINRHTAYQNQKLSPGAKKVVRTEQNPSLAGDTVSFNQQPAETGTYGVSKISRRVSSNSSDVRQMIVNTFKEQGISTRIASGDTTIDLKDLTLEEAKALVSEDGYWGVERTSDRIAEMAIALGENDPEKLAEIKSGIEKGFQMAADAFGGSLPDISMATFDAVMKKLEQWAGGVNVAR